jgi:predicted amidohydrolase YtcJ
MSRGADIIFLDARVVTVDGKGSVQEAVALKDGLIAAVGRSQDIENLKGPSTKVYRLGGASVLPGIIESHNHMIGYGTSMMGLDCKERPKSIEDIKADVKALAGTLPKGTWIRGRGYNQNKLLEKRHPNRQDLDSVAPDHPVALTRTCGHIVAANSLALKLAGIPLDAGDPVGGRFDRVDGKITGVMYETASAPLRAVSKYTVLELREGLKRTNDDWVKLGITSSHDASGGEGIEPHVMQELSTSGDLKIRTYFMVRHTKEQSLAGAFIRAGVFTGFGNDRLKLGALKVMVDGSSSGPTSSTRLPYTSNPSDSGILYFTQGELDELLEEGHANGFQVTTHAVGDNAVEMTVNAIERAMKKWPRSDPRHRIEHCGICPPDLIARIKKLGIVPVPQPIFFHEFGDGYLMNYGPDRVRWMFPARSFIDNGIIAPGSSDCPVTYVNPWLNMYEAVTRKTQTGQLCGTEERVTIAEAIKMFTWNGAYASKDERVKGSIEPGKFGDLVVLDRDILTTPVEEIKQIAPRMTVIGGEIVFNSIE